MFQKHRLVTVVLSEHILLSIHTQIQTSQLHSDCTVTTSKQALWGGCFKGSNPQQAATERNKLYLHCTFIRLHWGSLITSDGWWNHTIQTKKRKLLFSFSVSIKPQTGIRHQTNTTPTYFSIKFTHLNKRKWQNNNNAICQPGKEEQLPLPILTSSLSI